jgi:hypothetical protein
MGRMNKSNQIDKRNSWCYSEIHGEKQMGMVKVILR